MILKVKVKLNANEERLLKEGEEFIAFLKARPIKGEANLALIKLIARHFKIPTSKVKIKSGFTQRKKIIEIKETVADPLSDT